jgi:Putative zinc-finger
MTCEQVRALLPLAVYEDLTGPDAADVAMHLRDCPGCRAEEASLRQTRAALDAVPAPEVTVNPADVLRAESAHQARAMRRWRRLAVAATALAAGLLLVLAVRPQVRVGDGALVVRWADPPPAPGPVVHVQQVRDADQAERLEIIAALLRAAADDAEGRDRDRRAEIAALRARLDAVRLTSDARWEDIQKDMGVLYRLQFARKEGLE